MVSCLITGGSGFIGHHVVSHLMRTTDWELTVLDRLDHGGNMNRLAEIGYKGRFIYHDLRAEMSGQVMRQIGYHDYIIHMAAGTHVDRSIADPLDFVMNNVVATCNLLNFARTFKPSKMIYFSTDEVFGPAAVGQQHKEWDAYHSGNPYAATKAGGEELCLAFHNTYGTPVLITHTMNVFGERQHPEKFIPGTVVKVRLGEKVFIHADKTKTKPGSRFYIHAQSVAEAVSFLLKAGDPGDKYNIVGEKEVDNLSLALQIAKHVGRELHYELVDFHSSRPGHDLRYALDGSKMAKMGWKPSGDFEERLAQTVKWTLENKWWQLA